MLYDSRINKMIPGVKLWKPDVLRDEKYLNIHPHITSSYDVVSEDSISDKTSHLGVEAGLKMSFLGGMIEVSGSAKFMQDKKSSKRQSRISLQYKYTDRFEELTMEQMKEATFSQPIQKHVATHVATAVEYGVDAFFVFDREVTNNENYKEIQGSMQAQVKKLSSIVDVSGQASIGLTESEKENVAKFQCKFYGDIQLAEDPTNFDEAMKAYKDLPSLVKGKDEQGRPLTVPKRVWLYPLSLLDSKAAQLVQEVGDELITKAQDVMQSLDELKMRTNDLVKTEVYNIFPGIREQLFTFSEIMATCSHDRQSDLQTSIPQIRSGEEEKEQELDKAFSASSQRLQHLSSWLERKEEEVQVLMTYLDGMEGIQRAYIPGDLSAAINNVKYKFVVCFAMKVSGNDNPKLSTDADEDSEQPGVPWYRDPHLYRDVRHKAEKFTAFANAISSMEKEDVKCLVVNGCDTISDGKYAAIALYVDGEPKEIELNNLNYLYLYTQYEGIHHATSK